MDKKTLLGILLIFAVSIGYFYLTAPSKEEILKQRKHQDSLIAVQIKAKNDSVLLANHKNDTGKVQNAQMPSDTSAKNIILKDNLGEFAQAAQGKDTFYVVETDLLKLYIYNKGGRIGKVELKNYKTFDTLPLILFTRDSSRFNLQFYNNNRDISTNDLYFEPFIADSRFTGNHVHVEGNDSVSFAMRLYPMDSTGKKHGYIEYLYTIKGNNYMLSCRINFVGMQNTVMSNRDYINLEWRTELRQQEKGLDNERNVTTIYYKPLNDKVDYLSETKDDKKTLDSKVKWISFKQHFFTSILVAGEHFTNTELTTLSDKQRKNRFLKKMTANIGLPYNRNGDQSIAMSFYFGPNKYKILKKYGMDLERQIPLGWGFAPIAWINKYAVIPIFNFFEQFNWNYGIIILILTILLKIVLLPIAYKSFLSSAKMKVLKPEVDEATKNFTKKEDAMKKQQISMDIYRKAGVNPMAGCIPMLLQMPILFAMFRFFPASIELRQQSFLWAHDLSSYDSIWNLPFNIPFYGDHVSLFTLLMTITTIIYTKISNDMQGQTNQMPGMKVMMYIMPIMFLGIFNNFSSGLSYYYTLVNLLTFAQMYLIRKLVNEDKMRKQLKANMLNPKKKTGFQKRLEDLAKQRGYNPNNRKK